MPRVITEKKISGLSIDTVWLIAKDLESYPKFMDQVKSVEFIDAVEEVITSSWVVLFNGNELRWTEVDEFDNIRHRMSFRQIEGDLAKWEGSFEAIAVDGGVQCRYDVEFDLGIPALAHVLHPLGERAIADNCAQILQCIEERGHGAFERA